MTDYLLARARAYVRGVPQSERGNRNNTALSVAGHLHAFQTVDGQRLPLHEIIGLVQGWNLTNSEPLPESEIARTCQSATRNGTPRKPKIVRPHYNGALYITIPETAKNNAESEVPTARRVNRADPLPLAENFIETKYQDATGRLLIHRWRGDFWRWNGSCYEPRSDEAIDAELYRHLETLLTPKRIKGTGEIEPYKNGQPQLARLRPKSAMVRDVRLALPSRGLLIDDRTPAPCWLTGDHEIDARELLPCGNGLLHIPQRKLYPPTPDYFGVNALEYKYDPDAPEPEQWLAFLDDLWSGDIEAIITLQEWFGYVLTLNLALHKMLLLVGPKRSGKGTIGRVLTALLSAPNVAGPTLSSLTERFGLAPLLHKRLAIISDARLSGRADSVIVAERLLAISGEDAITIDIKYKNPITCTLLVRFMLMSNELPRIADSSGTLASRFIVLTLRRSFYGEEDTGLTARLLTELPGILNWALDGGDRLHEQGRFTEPKSSIQTVRELIDLGAPISVFVRDHCALREGASVRCDELFQAWKDHCQSIGRENPGDIARFGRDLRAAAPSVTTSNPLRTSGGRVRFFEGITITEGDQ